MLNRRIIWMLTGHACLLAAIAFAQAPTPLPPITAPVSLTRSYVFLPVGLAPTETAQVNVVNTAQVPATTTTAVSSCTGTISFLNASGAVIGKPTPFTVTAGQVFSASLPYGSAGVTGGARPEIRGEVQVTPTATTTTTTPPTFAPACSLSYSFETFDTGTGVTHVFIAGAGTTLIATPQPLFGR